MTDRPIIFSGPMVRALLAGRKTQTRRLATSPLARAEPGDRLYVRERGWISASGNVFTPFVDNEAHGTLHADKAVPSIHMPRWASRLTLTVTEVRFQPLQSITDADAIAEGLAWITPGIWSVAPSVPVAHERATDAYLQLWDLLHGDGAAATNPQILALTFTVERRNIDAKEAS